MMAVPWSRSLREMAYRSSLSRRDRAAVGSSIIKILAFMDSALAISTNCCWATDRDPTEAVGLKSAPTASSSFFASRLALPQSIKGPDLNSWPMKMFSATDKSG